MTRAIIILAAVVVASDGPIHAGDRVADRGDWPDSTELVVSRLAIQDQGMQHGTRVLSVIVELQNGSGHALEMEFDPHELRIEMFNSDGIGVEEGSVQRSGPVPMSHRMTISAGAYAGLPTHRGGVGLPVGQTLLAAGWQVWTLPPGEYTIQGAATITAGFGSAVLDPLLPNRNFNVAEYDFPPVDETKSISVELELISFEVDAINPEDATAAETP